MNSPLPLDELEARFAAREPTLEAFLPEEDRFGRLRREAGELLAAHPDPARRPALFGLPVGIKDIFHVKGFPTRAGSRLPPEELTGQEGPAVAALRRHGALIVGKTVSTEFAYFAPGPTRNPFDPERTPGGSSSGSAAAVAAGLCALALGTQTIGSIHRPAAFCGVVGFKPSYGRISTDGVIALAPSFDHVGFLSQDVATAALAAGALCEDWQPVELDRRPVLGIPEGPYLSHPSEEGSAHFRATCKRLEEAGYEVRPIPVMGDFDEIVARHRRVMAAETAQVHRDWFPRFRNLYAPQTVELIERGQGVPADEVERGRAGREKLRRELAEAMDAHGIDLWISPPALGPAPRGLSNTGDPIMNLPWTHAGAPTLGVPAGRSAEGLPMGLQIAGRFGEDAALLAWGSDLEKVLET